MNCLDQTGLEYLWGKIKTYVGTVVEDGIGEIVINWDDVRGKPSTFTPSTHTHTVSQITDFPTNIVTNVTISGSGNAVTNASFSDNTLTITKGTIESGGITEVTLSNLSDDLKNSIANANNVKMAYGKGQRQVIHNSAEQPLTSWIKIYIESLGRNNSAAYLPVKTINGQQIFGTGNINTNYTASGFAYSAGQFELQLKSGTGNTLRATCPFEYNNLAGIPTFKTINGQSIIGSGDIRIQGGLGGGGITQSEADGRCVNISGDTMTGALTISSGGITVGQGEISLSDMGGAVINNLIGNEDNPEMASFRITNGNPDSYGFYTNCTAYFNYTPIFARGVRVGTQANRNGLTVNINDSLQQVEFDTGAQGGFEFNSSVYALAFYESSDVSLKENIAPITKDATDAVDCLTFKQFNFKDDKDKTTKYGVIAQEVEAVGLGNLVKDNGETKSVDYISLLILKIEALEKRIAELETERR